MTVDGPTADGSSAACRTTGGSTTGGCTPDHLVRPGLAAGQQGSPWHRYASQLRQLQIEQQDAVRAGLLGERERAERTAFLSDRSKLLAEQRERLLALAADLRAPLTEADLSPDAVTGLPANQGTQTRPWAERTAALDAAVVLVDRTATETREIGELPQLLPAWHSNLARSTVAYLALVLPNALFSAVMAIGRATSWWLSGWFYLVFPLLVVTAGRMVVQQVSSRRIEDDRATARSYMSSSANRSRTSSTYYLDTRSFTLVHRDDRGSRSLALAIGLLLAWGSALVPAAILG